jgi:hypothetical protein
MKSNEIEAARALTFVKENFNPGIIIQLFIHINSFSSF